MSYCLDAMLPCAELNGACSVQFCRRVVVLLLCSVLSHFSVHASLLTRSSCVMM